MGDVLMVGPKRVVTVLGMHRSGTSCLAGSLAASGLPMGQVYAPAAHNQKGNHESPDVVKLNEAIVSRNGGDWDRPVAKCQWSEAESEEARRILAVHSGEPLWGFKDPRTLMTLQGWLKLVPNLERVGIFRHPLSVALSLKRRNDFAIEKSLKIWFAYNSLLLRELHREPFPLLCFDDDKSAFLSSLEELVEGLGLSNRGGYADFYESSLKHFDEKDIAKLPSKVIELYKRLQEKTKNT